MCFTHGVRCASAKVALVRLHSQEQEHALGLSLFSFLGGLYYRSQDQATAI